MTPTQLTELWHARFRDQPLVAHEVRVSAPRTRWVRFHALPESKRYTETPAERAVVLGRPNALLGELLAAGEPAVLLVTGYSTASEPDAPATGAPAGAWHWQSSVIDPDDAEPAWRHVFAWAFAWTPGVLDPVLSLVADASIDNVMVLPVDRAALYHPYDGGTDLILPDAATRGALRAKYRHWLSMHPSGL